MRLALLVSLLAALGSFTPASAEDVRASVTITSPHGRTGLPGKVRIVARVRLPKNATTPAVRFYVDNALLATDTNGPPYAAEWEDENPFESRRVAVEFDDPAAGVVRDEITLQPFELVEAAHVLSVSFDATVQDARGRFVGGLTASDFRLFEDGASQPIDSVSAERVSTTFAVLVDTSQSMASNIDFVRVAAGRFSAYLPASDNIIVAPFKNGITGVTGPTRDAATLMEAVAGIKAEGGTAILDALKQVAGRFADGPGRRVVVLVTDGYDERSQDSPDEVLELLKMSRVSVHVIAVGGVSGVSRAGERLLRRIAQETGGRAFFPWNQKELTQAHAAIAEETRHLYQIAYTPVNQRQDGTWRAIAVTAAVPDSQVRARRGYRAPAPPPVRPSLEFTATDENGQFVDLTRDDLTVIEDGVPQKVEIFQEAVAPVSIVVALDASGSMAKAADDVKTAAQSFVEALRPEDPLGVLLFSDTSVFTHDLTTNRQDSLAAIDGYSAKGGTALYDGLTDALMRLKQTDGRKVVVLLSDGRDEDNPGTGPGSTRTLKDVLAALKETDAVIYPIGLGPRVDRPLLERLAAESGGVAYFPESVSSLRDDYARVVESIRRRYVVSYSSTNAARDGGWRSVRIEAGQHGTAIRSRGGYFAPDNSP